MGLHFCTRIKHVENTEVVAPHSAPGGGGSVLGGTVCAGAYPGHFPKREKQEGYGPVARREKEWHSRRGGHLQMQWASPVCRDEGVGSVGGAFRDGVLQDCSDRIEHFVLKVSYFLADSSKSTQVFIQGVWNRQPASNAEVAAAGSLAPRPD